MSDLFSIGGGNVTELREYTAWVPSVAADYTIGQKSGTDLSSANVHDPTFEVKIDTSQLADTGGDAADGYVANIIAN